MDGKNHEVLAMAFKRAKGKSKKIAELGITPKISKKATDELIVKLADEKLADTTYTKDRNDAIKGQRWYVEDLIAFSALNVKERLDHEYEASFADIAGEDEMLTELEKLMA